MRGIEPYTAPLRPLSGNVPIRRNVSEPSQKLNCGDESHGIFNTMITHLGIPNRPSSGYSDEVVEQTHELSQSEDEYSILASPPLNIRKQNIDSETILQSEIQQADDDSFDVETEDSPQLMFTPGLEVNYQSPPIDTLAELGIRKSILSDFSFTSGDAYQDYLEDRLASWRPNQSQHNSNLVLNGNHPYHAQNFGKLSPPRINSGLFLFSWFGNKSDDLEKQLNSVSPQKSVEKVQLTAFYTASDFTSPNQDIHNLLKTVQFQPNSSNSFLPRTKTVRSNAAIHSSTAGESPTEVAFTPYAIPLSEFELNYNRRSRGEDMNINDHDMLGDEMLGIINGTENFVTSCFHGFFSIFEC